MTNQQEGIVLEASGRTAKVKTSRHSDCANCGSCPGNSATVLDVRNPLGAKVGQKVVIVVREGNMLKAAFIVYILPLIAVSFGAIAGGGAAATWAGSTTTGFGAHFTGGAIAFLAAIRYVKHYDSNARKEEKMQPVITRILSS